ncbi:MAG: PqqD family peptide modification chaperone, partial [Clostridiales bacterium]|nr:PqqD family peptide modification chaperone [Clostridiales bacterium]
MVHQYQLNGYNIVLDTASGSVHAVDEVAYDIIALYKEKTREEIIADITVKHGVTAQDVEECLDDVAQLIEEKKLFSEDIYEDLAFDFKKRPTVIKALCLHVAHTCNLNCSYCFASQGKYH